MEQNEHINQLINNTINSLDGVGRATPKPFLLTRINARMENDVDTIWDRTLQFISKPTVALAAVVLVIVINTIAIAFNHNSNKSTAQSLEQFTSMVDENYNTMAINYETTNTEP